MSGAGAAATATSLAIGTVEPRKDLPGLVAAVRPVAAEDADLRLVSRAPTGGAPTRSPRPSPVAARRPHHADRLGRRATPRLDLLAGALSLVLPSRYEGFGLPASRPWRRARR